MDTTAQILAKLERIERRQRNIERRLNELQVHKRKDIDADEAARLLGIKVTPSGTHRRQLAQMYKEGIISTVYGRRPYRYDRQEIAELAKEGRLYVRL